MQSPPETPATTDKPGPGRPTEYDPAYCERVVSLGKEGKSRAEIASALGHSRQTLANWEKAHPEFLDALSRAKDEELAWWEGQAREGINKGSAFNATLWAKSVNGRFPAEPYRERVQLTGAGDGPVQTLDLTKATDEQLAKLEALIGEVANPGGNQGGTDTSGDPGASGG